MKKNKPKKKEAINICKYSQILVTKRGVLRKKGLYTIKRTKVMMTVVIKTSKIPIMK
jgi:hypothetical protein